MIDKATVKKILDTADIVEVVSDYVSLTKRGANYMGLCPFHNERTPSFSVSPARGICHCFSCGKGGSPVNFIMEKEGVNFHDALLHLARKYGIKVEERQLTDEERAEQSRRESLLIINEWAMKQFEHNLRQTDEGRDVGLTYLYRRGVTQAAIDKFHLGYAIDRATVLYESAHGHGFDTEALMETGLCGKSSRDGRPYDRFRGRVIFPVFSPSGKVIAFGARGIKGETAKYVNSPESLVYHKSSELYGIYQAKNAIVRHKKCYLVEGYMDVIAMWQSGMENTVASSGTSLTDGQIALIHRFTENVTLIYDGDTAGVKASLRGIDLLLSHKLDIKVLLLPDGEDPDSFARKHTPEEFRRYVQEHEEDFIAFKTRTLLGSADSRTASGRAEAVGSIVTSIASVPDLVKRSIYIQETARVMNVSERILTVEVGKALAQTEARLRQRRQQDRMQATQAYPPTQVSAATAASPAGDDTASPKPGPVDPRLLAGDSPHNPMASVERNILEYVIRYGMMTFCEADPAPDGHTPWLNVAEFVRYELQADNMSFSTPLYAKTFGKILSLIDSYRADEAKLAQDIAKRQGQARELWCASLASQAISIRQIEAKEKEYAENQEKERIRLITEFAADYIGHELGSDPDDDIRHLVLDVITPRYTLSKYHTKNVHVATEQERLGELVPRALYEWKDALLAELYRKTQDSLRQAAASGDTSQTETLIRQLQNISEMRREVAKAIGERIVTPHK